jgi:hypothetical protein
MSITTGPGRPVVAIWKASSIVAARSRRVLHQIIVLGAVAGDADRVGFLEGVGADQMRSAPGR